MTNSCLKEYPEELLFLKENGILSSQVKQTCRSDLDFQVKDEEVEHEDHSI